MTQVLRHRLCTNPHSTSLKNHINNHDVTKKAPPQVGQEDLSDV